MPTKRKVRPLLTNESRSNAVPGRFELPFPLDGIALREWHRILDTAYWLKESESVSIADRCLCLQRLLECEEDIRQRGHMIRTRNGMVTNPSIRIGRGYRISIQKHDSELGLTAASRSRLTEAQLAYVPGSLDDPLERKLCG